MKRKSATPRMAAEVSTGKTFTKGGSWAGQQLLKAMNAGQGITPAALKTADTLRKDEWVAFDNAVIEEGHLRMRGIADLISAGLTIPIANSLGKTILQYHKMGDMNPAQVSMDGMDKTEDDRLNFELGNLPLPIIHKDWSLNLRTLTASRMGGEALDTTQTRVAGRLVAEQLEYILFRGYAPKFLGFPIYGYTSHPDRNQAGFGTNGNWSQVAKVGADIVADVQTMITGLHADRYFGPYVLYVDASSSRKLEDDYKANGDMTIRERILKIDGISKIVVADQMPTDNVVLVQLTRDVVALVQGEPLQTIQWDIEGGFNIMFKAFTIQVPLLRSDDLNQSGIFHMS